MAVYNTDQNLAHVLLSAMQMSHLLVLVLLQLVLTTTLNSVILVNTQLRCVQLNSHVTLLPCT